MASARSLDEAPLLADTGAAQTKSATRGWSLPPFHVCTQFAYNAINTFAFSGYTSATLITDLAGLENDYYGMSKIAIIASIVPALGFAWAETYAHYVESEHFNHSSKQDDASERDIEAANPPAQRLPITWGQSICAAMHYASDVYSGTAPILAFAKLAGIDEATNLTRGMTYSAMALYSIFGNAQEFINARIAFSEANTRHQRSSARI